MVLGALDANPRNGTQSVIFLRIARKDIDAAIRRPDDSAESLALAWGRAWQRACSKNRSAFSPIPKFRGARLSRRHRLHGPRQLGDGACRRLKIRHGPFVRRGSVEPDGDRPTGAFGAARFRDRARSRPELRPSLSPPREAGVLADHGAGDRRHRPRRSHRHRDRT